MLGKIFITYPKALAEKVISKSELKHHFFDISVGDEVSTEDLTETLFCKCVILDSLEYH